MKVKVTQQHIDSGVRGCAFDCPVALALMDAGDFAYTAATGTRVQLWLKGSNLSRLPDYEVALPPNVWTFISRFDAGKTVAPFEFEIDLT